LEKPATASRNISVSRSKIQVAKRAATYKHTPPPPTLSWHVRSTSLYAGLARGDLSLISLVSKTIGVS